MEIGAILPVGTIIHSMLSTTQFATEYGDNWVLADGRSVTGTRYASITGFSIVPDLRGAFLRGKGATLNPDGDLALGTLTPYKTGTHTHLVIKTSTSGTGNNYTGFTGTDFFNFGPPQYNTYKGVDGATNGNETAPTSVTVNIFIKIN